MNDPLEPGRARWLAPAFFAAAAAAVLLPALLGADPIYGFDTVQEKFFWRSWAFERLARGEWPWWCAGLVGGFPLIAEPIAQFWYPPVALLHLLLPIGPALNLTWWLHLTWAGLGMYRLLRGRGIGGGAATLGGLAYGTSGWMIGHVPMGGLPHLASCAWAPWLVAALLRLAEVRGSPTPREVAIAAATVGASLLAGHAQFAYGALLFAAVFAVLVLPGQGCASDPGDSRGASQPRRAAPAAKLLALTLALGLGAGAAGAMMVPYAELLAASNRGAALPGDFADFGARLPALQLLGTFAPGFFGGSGGVPYWGFPTREAVTPYLGIVPLALALSPVPRRARREAWALRALGVLGLLLAMGSSTPLLGWLRAVAPLLDRARHPARWIEVSILAGSWVAAWGAQLVIDRSARVADPGVPRRAQPPAGAGLAVVALLALAVGWMFTSHPSSPTRHAALIASRIDDSALAEGDGLRTGAPERMSQARERSAAACARAVAYASAALALVMAARVARQPRSAALVLVGVTALDLISNGRREIVPFDRLVLPWPAAIDRLAAGAAPHERVGTTFPGAGFPFPAAFRDSHAALSRIGQADMHRPLLASAASPQGGIPTTPGRWLRLALGEGSYDFNYAAVGPRTIVDRLSVGLLLTAPGVRPAGPAWTRVYADGERWLWRNEQVHPRATLVHRCVALDDPNQVLDLLRDPRRDRPASIALAAGRCPAGIEVVAGDGERTETVRWLVSNDELVALETRTESGALLRLADAAMPGWAASVDGRPVPIEPVDFALRGVVVPPGTHRVEFRYRPHAAWVGIATALAASSAISVLFALPARRGPSFGARGQRGVPLSRGWRR